MPTELQVNKKASSSLNVAIVGGGIAGATIALYLSELGINVTLLEKGPSLVNGPPICHLHAGGNLYPEISEQQCLTLLAQSIDILRLYPYAADHRPTVIAVPKMHKSTPQQLLPRLNKLQTKYQDLIEQDIANKQLGESEDYYQLFSRQEVEKLASKAPVSKPQTLSEWIIPVAKNIDLDNFQFPLIMVQEYGLNLFRLAATAGLSLQKNPHCQLLMNCKVQGVKALDNQAGWQIDYQTGTQDKLLKVDYLINAAGFRTGLIDDMLGFKRQRLVEFKAAYVTHWSEFDYIWPEVIFYGERGTPNGMAQLTPYPGGYFQLHGMSQDITLFKDGLVASSEESAQPKLSNDFINKIDVNWAKHEIDTRSQSAIDYLSSYIASFRTAQIASKPLFGAQQIPGGDPSLRASDVSFVGDNYARCEIVKASSVLTAADEVLAHMKQNGLLSANLQASRVFPFTKQLEESEILAYAKGLTTERHYPSALAEINVAAKDKAKKHVGQS